MNSDLVVMDNSIVKASYNLSVSEQRLLLSALAQIPKNQPIDPKQAYYITREDFIRLGANADQATRDIRNATKDLMKKTLLIETNAGILEFHWLSEVLRFDKNADARLKAKYPNPEDYKNYINGLRKYNLLESLPFGRRSDDIVARVVFDSRILPLLSELKANFTQFLLDDVANFIPSRITALLIALLFFSKKAFLEFRKYGKKHESINAGFPISAMALSINVKLGGPTSYFGKIKNKPFFGDGKKYIENEDVLKALSLRNRLDVFIVSLLILGVLI